MKENYTPGQDCQCHAYSEAECGCDVDWTPKEVYDLREQRDRLADELNEWKTLSSWGGTPEIINDFIKGQQSRIYAAQEAEEQRDRLAEALRNIMKYRRGEKPYDYWRLNENDRGNAQFDGWNEIEDRINEALKVAKGGKP